MAIPNEQQNRIQEACDLIVRAGSILADAACLCTDMDLMNTLMQESANLDLYPTRLYEMIWGYLDSPLIRRHLEELGTK